MKIQILMSTCNGEKYIREQLDSIAAQTEFDKIKVLIRDDMSTDATPDILKEYSEKYGVEVIYGEQNIGVNRSVWELLSYADKECDLFAFCDQDDFWLKRKVANVFEIFNGQNADTPILYVCRSRLVDEELRVIGDMPKPSVPCRFYTSVIQNVFPGHAMVFNRALLDIMKLSDISQAKVYDWWAYITATAFGKVIYDERVGVLYRQHTGNTVGYQLSGTQLLKARIQRMNNESLHHTAVQAKSFYDQYLCELSTEYRWELNRFLSAKSLWRRIKYAVKTKFYRQSAAETLIFKIFFVLGKYNI